MNYQGKGPMVLTESAESSEKLNVSRNQERGY